MEEKEIVLQTIDTDVKNNPIVLYMKGNELMPQCGFSARAVSILNALGVEYTTRNVLADPVLREAIKEYSDWPTIPQLYVKGEFVGGSDIMLELYNNGELAQMMP